MQSTQLNNAHSNKWVATFEGMEGLTYKIVGGIMPAATTGITELGGSENVSLSVPGDHITYDDLSIDFLIDEDYINYAGVFNWLEENTRVNEPTLRDMSIHLLDTNGNFRGIRVELINCWPTAIMGWPIDNENADSDVQSTATFKYERMRFMREPLDGSEATIQQ